MNVPDSPKKYTMAYENLKGVDLSKDQTEVDRYHSPDMLNMISDEGGNPVKRIGWRSIIDGGNIIDFLIRTENGQEVMYVLKDTSLDKYIAPYGTGETVITVPFTGKTFSGDSKFVQFKGDVLLFTQVDGYMCLYKISSGGEIKTLKISDGEHDSYELDNVYIPQVITGRCADGTAGTTLDDTSLLTRFREYRFSGLSTDETFYFYPKAIREENAYKYLIKGTVKVYATTATGERELTSSEWSYTGSDVSVQGFDENGKVKTYTVRPCAITINTGILDPETTGRQADNLRIIFKPFNNEDLTINGVTSKRGLYYEKSLDLYTPRASAVFGYSAIDRLFLAGGKELNTVYFSDVEDPTYFPDLNYITVGQSTNGITGFHRVSQYLVALKDDASEESTSFLIKGFVYDEGGVNERTTFGVMPMTSGIGALAPSSFGTLADEPLFLSRTGIYGIANTYSDTEKSVQNRSGFINRVLLGEGGLDKACCTVWNSYYILCVNGNAYVLDGRQKSADPSGGSTYFYEAYVWNNIPAVKMQSHHGELWFLSADNRICRFNTDITNNTKYQDDGTLTNGKLSGGTPIKCRWTSCLDDCYRPQYLKTVTKRGALITIAPHERTSITISIIKDGVTKYTLDPFYFDISDWNNIDYQTFVISTSNIAEDAFLKKKMKKFKRLQIVAENNEINEPFGILSVLYTYTIGNLAKK